MTPEKLQIQELEQELAVERGKRRDIENDRDRLRDLANDLTEQADRAIRGMKRAQESERDVLDLYRLAMIALTEAINRPKGVVPDGDGWAVYMRNGRAQVHRFREYKEPAELRKIADLP